MNNQQTTYIEEDEIDLRELFLKIWSKRLFILLFTSIITLLAVIYSFMVTPVYETKAIVEIGNYKDKSGEVKLLEDVNKLSQELNVLYIELFKNDKERTSWIETIAPVKKQNNFLEIRSQAHNNKDAIVEMKKVMAYITKKHLQYINEVKKQKQLELTVIENKIDLLKNTTLVNINADIKYLKTVMIPSLEKKIKVSQEMLKNRKEQLSEIEKNIIKTQNNNASLTALNVLDKRSLKSEISNLEIRIIDLQNSLENQINLQLPQKIQSRDNLLNITLTEMIENKNIIENALLPHNYKNSAIVGKIIQSDSRIKPKRSLIVVVAFVTGFIMSIFLVFLIEFFKGIKEEEKSQ